MAVIFDLDGTLLDTPAGIVNVARMTAQDLNIEAPADTVIRAVIGKPLIQLFSTFGGTAARHELAVVRFRELFTEYVVASAAGLVFPGIRETLEALSGRAQLAVATSKILRSAEEILEAADLLQLFDVVAGADSVDNPKPAPDMAISVAEKLGRSPDSCVVVGDSIHDIGMASSAHMHSVGVLWGVDSKADLLAAGANAICEQSVDLLEALEATTQPKDSLL